MPDRPECPSDTTNSSSLSTDMGNVSTEPSTPMTSPTRKLTPRSNASREATSGSSSQSRADIPLRISVVGAAAAGS